MTQVEEAPKPLWWSWARENVIWILTTVPIALAGLRVLIVSRGEPETLRALLSNVNVFSLVLGTLLPTVPILVFWGWIAYIEWDKSRPKVNKITLPWPFTAWIYGPLAGIIMLMSPMTLIIHLVGLTIIVGAFLYRRRKGYPPGNAPLALGALALVLFGNTFVSSPQPWLPHEIITVKDSASEVGYVLSSDPRWTTYLAKNGPVKHVASADVISRQVCTFNNSKYARPIVTILSDKNDPTPPCPED